MGQIVKNCGTLYHLLCLPSQGDPSFDSKILFSQGDVQLSEGFRFVKFLTVWGKGKAGISPGLGLVIHAEKVAQKFVLDRAIFYAGNFAPVLCGLDGLVLFHKFPVPVQPVMLGGVFFHALCRQVAARGNIGPLFGDFDFNRIRDKLGPAVHGVNLSGKFGNLFCQFLAGFNLFRPLKNSHLAAVFLDKFKVGTVNRATAIQRIKLIFKNPNFLHQMGGESVTINIFDGITVTFHNVKNICHGIGGKGFRVFVHHKGEEVASCSQPLKGERLNPCFNRLAQLNSGIKNLAFNQSIIKRRVCFVKVIIINQETENGFRARLEIPPGIAHHGETCASGFVCHLVDKLNASHIPQINHGERIATEKEVFHIGPGRFTARGGIVNNFFTPLALTIFPIIVVVGIKRGKITLGKGNSLHKVKHGVVCRHIIDVLAIGQQFLGNIFPQLDGDFTVPQLFHILRALVAVIGGIENVRDKKGFLYQIRYFFENLAAIGHNSPPNIIDKGLRQTDFLLVLRGKFPFLDKRQGGGFTVQNNVQHTKTTFLYLVGSLDYLFIIHQSKEKSIQIIVATLWTFARSLIRAYHPATGLPIWQAGK